MIWMWVPSFIPACKKAPGVSAVATSRSLYALMMAVRATASVYMVEDIVSCLDM